MKRLPLVLATLLLGACAANMGAPDPIDMPTVAIRAQPGTSPADVAAALRDSGARAAFVASSEDREWFAAIATAANLHLSGPADMGGLRMGFIAPEPLGDTTHTITYAGGGSLTIQDALYEIDDDRLLDLLAFRMEAGMDTRAAMEALLEYVATDVGNSAALVMAAAVPSAAVGDSVARLLSPAYFDALRCEAGAAAPSDRSEIRLFYGPEARMYCADASADELAVGESIRAELVMGRR